MAADLAKLNKSAQKAARSYASSATRRVREKVAEERMVNSGIALVSSAAAAVVDHQWREGTDAEARFGNPGAQFRPPVNAVIGAAALAAGLFGPKGWSGPALAVGIGFGAPAVYSMTRNQLYQGQGQG